MTNLVQSRSWPKCELLFGLANNRAPTGHTAIEESSFTNEPNFLEPIR
jgi:hypothetical protein